MATHEADALIGYPLLRASAKPERQAESGTQANPGAGPPRKGANPGRRKRPRSTARRDAVRARFELLNAIADRALPKMTGRADVAVWLALYRHANAAGEVAAAASDLARRVGCNEKTARLALKRLQTAGLVELAKRGSLAGGPSRYRLLPPKTGPA